MNREIKRIIDKKISGEKEILGAFLIGSVARGEYNERSDIDLVFIKRRFQPRKKERMKGRVVDCIYFPLDFFKSSLSSSNVIQKGAVVFWLKNCRILYDPENEIKGLVERVKGFRFSKKEIGDQLKLALVNLKRCENFIQRGRLIEALSHLRLSANFYANSILMSKNETLLIPPKNLEVNLRKTDFYDLFLRIHSIRDVLKDELEENLKWLDRGIKDRYSKYKKTSRIQKETKGRFEGMKSELENAFDEFEKKNLKGSLLQLRYSLDLFIDVFLIEKMRVLSEEISERIECLRHFQELFERYLKIQGFEENSLRDVEDLLEDTKLKVKEFQNQNL
ncbi:MAG: nucleotidyltransferase domain-containing protein [Candidatus Methanofastidiosia archaeon]